MTKDEIYEAGKVMLAYAEGKEIQYKAKGNNTWINATKDFNPKFNWSESDYRIKPKPKYRPFESSTECFEEMSKHQPVGWCKKTYAYTWLTITSIGFNDVVNFDEFSVGFSFKDCLKKFTFADGTPFGIKIEED